MRFKFICLMSLILLGLFLTGCATKGRPFQLVQPIPSGKGVLYIFNDPDHHGSSEVLINDNAVGHLRHTDYLAFLCQPGPLTVSTGWETEINSVSLNIEPDSQNFVSVEHRSLVARAILSLGLAPSKYDIKPKLIEGQVALSQIKKMSLIEPSQGLASELSGFVAPGIDMARFKTLYVDIGENGWETPPLIVNGLNARGYTVKSGESVDMPSDTECLVKIQENWFWDLGMYLLELKVEFKNPINNAVYASATVKRAIPQGRRGPKIMATEALNAIFNKGLPAGIEGLH